MCQIHTHNGVRPPSPKHHFVPLQFEPFWNSCGCPEAIHSCVVVKHRARQVLTAIHTLENTLRLFSWRVNADGAIGCTGTAEAQLSDVVQVDLVRGSKYVTGCRTEAGELHLQCWDVSNTGAIYASGESVVAGVDLQWMQLLVLSPYRLLTIGLSKTGEWELTTWEITQQATLRKCHQTTMPAANGALAATCLPTPELDAAVDTNGDVDFVIARHTAPDVIRWQQWRSLTDGQLVLQKTADLNRPDIVDLALITVDQTLMTLLHNAHGQLDCIRGWPTAVETAVPSDDIVLADTKSCTLLARDVHLFAVTPNASEPILACATRHPSDSLEPLAAASTLTFYDWQATAGTWSPCGTDRLPATTATDLAICNQPLEGNAPFLTAVGTDVGTLHLVTWGEVVDDV